MYKKGGLVRPFEVVQKVRTQMLSLWSSSYPLEVHFFVQMLLFLPSKVFHLILLTAAQRRINRFEMYLVQISGKNGFGCNL